MLIAHSHSQCIIEKINAFRRLRRLTIGGVDSQGLLKLPEKIASVLLLNLLRDIVLWYDERMGSSGGS